MSKILITTGGTGGHIYPALAVAKKLKEDGHEIVFIGTSIRMEKDLIPNEKFKFYGLEILPLRSIKSILKMLIATFKSYKIMKKEKVDKVIGFGNYISIPALISAIIMRKDIYLQEQNVSMGQANKYFYPFSKKVFLAFPETIKLLKNKYREKYVVTGNPIRESFYKIDNKKAREVLEIKEDKKVLTIMGGSLGAKNINEAIVNNLDKLNIENIEIYWATGKENYDNIIKRIKENNNIKIKPYFDNADLIMASSDLLICRAGASTISELIELEKPALLIPYDFVGQKENAEVLEIINAAKIYSNENVDVAVDEAIKLIQNDDLLKIMKENIFKIKPGNSAEIIASYFK